MQWMPMTTDINHCNLSDFSAVFLYCCIANNMANNLSIEQRIEIVEYYATNSAKDTARIFNQKYPDRPHPLNERTVRRLAAKLKSTGSLRNVQTKSKNSKSKDPVQIARVIDQFEQNHHCTLRAASYALQICPKTVRKVLKAEKYRPYKYAPVHRLQRPQDPGNRTRFCNAFTEMMLNDPELDNKVLWTDESIFQLSAAPNKQNYR